MLFNPKKFIHKAHHFGNIPTLKRAIKAKDKTYIKQAILDVNMVNGHDGLADIAKKSAGIDIGKLSPGELVLFINSTQTKMKLLGSNGSLIYIKTNGRIPVTLLKHLPEILGSRETLNYDEVMAPYLIKEVNREG